MKRTYQPSKIRRAPKPIALPLFGALNELGFALARGEPELDEESALEAIGRLLDGLAPGPARAPDR